LCQNAIWFEGGTDFYQYAENDLVLFNDPLGLKTCALAGSVDLFSFITQENPQYGPWILSGTGTMSGSRGPWGGGAPPANPPAGVN